MSYSFVSKVISHESAQIYEWAIISFTSFQCVFSQIQIISILVIKGAMNGEAFAAYIRQVLAPELLPGTVVICDNLATHRNKDAAQALKDVGCWILYLPPYSPDLNPIEMAFSKLKAHLRRIGARTFDQMFDALAEVCNLFTPQECWNYFCEAGYGSG